MSLRVHKALIQFLLFSCRFWENARQIIGWCALLPFWVVAPSPLSLENYGSATTDITPDFVTGCHTLFTTHNYASQESFRTLTIISHIGTSFLTTQVIQYMNQ